MPTLRLVQGSAGEGRFTVEATLESAGRAPFTVRNDLAFALTEADETDLRWYLERFLQQPGDVERKVAARVEGRLRDIGEQLFGAVFSSDQGKKLWGKLEEHIGDTRVEVRTEIAASTAIPWELMRDPGTGGALALRARSFVRVPSETAIPASLPDVGDGAVRILLVICRPGRDEDVPFRSVATRLIKGLSDADRERVTLDVLRPPTFARLGEVLRAAKRKGDPYHVVHFDGHGAYLERPEEDEGLTEALRRMMRRLMPVALSSGNELFLDSAHAGSHGYLVFENPGVEENLQLVDGPSLGRLLVEASVPVLVLNACRSAHADGPEKPQPADAGKPVEGDEKDDRRERALGSLAHEVVDQGVAGVLAMRYNVYVVTAAQLVADLYAALVAGHDFGEAVSAARRKLGEQPLRTIGYEPVRLEDWSVPVVYEAAPIRLFAESEAEPLRIDVGAGTTVSAQAAIGLPPEPDAGFFGRDGTLLRLDRAFDTHPVVLLHAYAGSGKTVTAAEFARWYQRTGGVEGPILFTSFEKHRPLARALDTLALVFGKALEQVNWSALDDAQRRDIALQLLKQVPVLWIWDNVEPITGFPAGRSTPWSAAEQAELLAFLRDARGTKAKFLLTSRRDEQAWLGDLPARIRVPPMPMQERVALARAIMAKRGRQSTDIRQWRPLLEFTGGNPLTLTVVVGQALRDGLTGKEAIEEYVRKLRAGEAGFEDEVEEGRARSLGASLKYGFDSFDDKERGRLAVLAMFQAFVDVDALRVMGQADADWCLPELHGITRDVTIALLDRAAEIGLLVAHGGGYYSVHPALPWFFSALFERQFPGEHAREAERAFAHAMGSIGSFYHRQFMRGDRDVIAALSVEEDNLLHGWDLARRHGLWSSVIGAMQGIWKLYDITGRSSEWVRLVEAVIPEFVDPQTGGPFSGREQEWSIVTDYRVRLAIAARNWSLAEHLQTSDVAWCREQVRPSLDRAPESLTASEGNVIHSLGVSLHSLGRIRRERGDVTCVENFRESLHLHERLGDKIGAAMTSMALGTAYLSLEKIRDLDEAERWYRRSLELHDEDDSLGRAGCHGQLGAVAYERFLQARRADRPATEALPHITAAATAYQRALDLLPPHAVKDLAVTHNQLGIIYAWVDLDRSLNHSRECIALEERAGNRFGAAQTQFNVALDLADAGRFEDALAYARGALHNYQSSGVSAGTEIEKTQQLLGQLEAEHRRRS